MLSRPRLGRGFLEYSARWCCGQVFRAGRHLSDVVPSPFGRGARGEGGDDFSDSPTEFSDGRDESGDRTYVDIDTFEATF
jgi:hypothetical protein